MTNSNWNLLTARALQRSCACCSAKRLDRPASLAAGKAALNDNVEKIKTRPSEQMTNIFVRAEKMLAKRKDMRIYENKRGFRPDDNDPPFEKS